jgi:hypothetical protein
MMLFGFAIGAGLAFAAVYTMDLHDKTTYLAAMGIAGVILAAITFLIYRAGVFVLGAGIGLVVSIYVLHPTSSAIFFLCILIGVGLGVLAMRYAREVIIVGTSILGGGLAGVSLAKIGQLSEIPYGIGLSAGFILFGILVQFALNKPEKEDEDEEEYVEERKPVDRYDEDEEDFDFDYEDLEAFEEEQHGKRSKNKRDEDTGKK